MTDKDTAVKSLASSLSRSSVYDEKTRRVLLSDSSILTRAGEISRLYNFETEEIYNAARRMLFASGWRETSVDGIRYLAFPDI